MKPDKLKRSHRRFRWYFEQGSNSSPKFKWALTNPILNKLSFKLTQLLILLLVGYKSHFICVVIPQALRFPFNRPSNVCSSRLGHSNFGREKKNNLRPQCNSNKLIINCLIWCVMKGWGWGERGDFHLCYHLIAGRLLWILQDLHRLLVEKKTLCGFLWGFCERQQKLSFLSNVPRMRISPTGQLGQRTGTAKSWGKLPKEREEN